MKNVGRAWPLGLTLVSCWLGTAGCGEDAAVEDDAALATPGDAVLTLEPEDTGSGECVPVCFERACGPDGCGGSCGECGAGDACHDASGTCHPSSCQGFVPTGCCASGAVFWCEAGQVRSLHCGEEPSCGWSPVGQSYDCGTTGASDPDGVYARVCPGCEPDCAGRACGSDGCGGSCGECGDGEVCDESDGTCAADPCQGIGYEGCCAGEVLTWCEEGELLTVECAESPACGWSDEVGYYDCGTSGDPEPSGALPLQCGECTASCDGKACGSDGCGGSCGECGEGQTCGADGQCAAGSCGDVPYEGCCAGEVLTWCEEGALETLDCAGTAGCGWFEDGGYYDCDEASVADPTGTFPLACP
jgi:hypothetical protein